MGGPHMMGMLKSDEEKLTCTRHWCSGLPDSMGLKEKPLLLLEHHEPCRRSESASLIWVVNISITWKWILSNNHVVSCCTVWFI